jgi:hypothetical protein
MTGPMRALSRWALGTVAGSAVALLTLAGCRHPVEGGQEPGLQTTPVADADAHPGDRQALAAGYLTHYRGDVDPYCHGVLVDSTTVLTAAHCVAGVPAAALAFAVEADPGYEIPVRRVSGDPFDEHRPEQQRGVWLELEQPLERATSAEMTTVMPTVGDRLALTSFTHTERIEGAPAAKRWTAVVTEQTHDGFVAELLDGSPGCHGDLGVPAFFDGAVAGVLVDVLPGGPDHPEDPICFTRFEFAR